MLQLTYTVLLCHDTCMLQLTYTVLLCHDTSMLQLTYTVLLCHGTHVVLYLCFLLQIHLSHCWNIEAVWINIIRWMTAHLLFQLNRVAVSTLKHFLKSCKIYWCKKNAIKFGTNSNFKQVLRVVLTALRYNNNFIFIIHCNSIITQSYITQTPL